MLPGVHSESFLMGEDSGIRVDCAQRLCMDVRSCRAFPLIRDSPLQSACQHACITLCRRYMHELMHINQHLRFSNPWAHRLHPQASSPLFTTHSGKERRPTNIATVMSGRSARSRRSGITVGQPSPVWVGRLGCCDGMSNQLEHDGMMGQPSPVWMG